MEAQAPPPEISWKLGVEIELMAPRGKDRFMLAQTLAQRVGGSIEGFFHPDAEPSKVPGQKLFHNLTPGFAVFDRTKRRLCHVVDDITLQDDLERSAAPQPGWYRLVSDDARLLRLVARYSQPTLPIAESLVQVGALFGTSPKPGPNGLYRLADGQDAPIAMAAPLPGERERPCELVTAPIEEDHARHLTLLLEVVQELGFYAPQEGATHIHFDASRLCQPRILRNLVNLLHPHRALLRRLLRTNPRCRRLGPWPEGLLEVLRRESFLSSTWEEACDALMETKPSKYRDFNLRNVLAPLAGKHTFEVRTLPVSLEVDEILHAAALFQAVLERACEDRPVEEIEPALPTAQSLDAFLSLLPLEEGQRHHWSARVDD